MLEARQAEVDVQVVDVSGFNEARLWSEWSTNRDAEARHQLIQHYSEWTRYMARRVFMRVRIPGVEWHDFVSYATIGLLESIDRFDPERGLQFTTYARHRVRGAILNGLRECREHAEQTQDTHLKHQVERSESLNEDGTGDLLAEIVQVSVGLAIGHLLDTSSLPQGGDVYSTVEHDCLMENLAALVEALPDKERRVIRYHYYQHLAFVEIAELLGLTKGRISQLHKQGVSRIRKQFEATGNLNILV